MLIRIRLWALALVLLGVVTISVLTMGQTSPANAPAANKGPVVRYTATTANVSGAPDSVRIDVLAWSTEADRDQMLAAWNLTAPAGGARGAQGGQGGRGAEGGRGGRGAGGRGGDAPQAGAAPANPTAAPAAAAGGAPAAAGAPPAAGAAANAAGGRGAAGRGGGGGGGGRGGAGAPADARPATPERSLATALQAGRTVGYVWTSESAGYSIKYAYLLKQPDGGERIIFATDRRLGGWNELWKPAGGGAVTDYEFSLIELRLNAKGDGEGKASVTGKVAVDTAANNLALDGYAALPVVLKDVKRRN